MKRTIVAILALSPVLLHAQAKSSAQPSSTPVLQSLNNHTAVLVAATNPAPAPAPAPVHLRVSTGVTAPVLIHTVALKSNAAVIKARVFGERTVIVSMTIDETGKPSGLKVLQSADAVIDQDVLNTVKEFRYQPATLDGAPVIIPLTLRYVIQLPSDL